MGCGLEGWATPLNQKTREGCGCPKFLAGRVFQHISKLLENSSTIFRQHKMLSYHCQAKAGPTRCRGAERWTLKTAGKQLKKVPSGPRAKETAEEQLDKHPKHAKQLCFRPFGWPFGCFLAGKTPALYPGPTRHLFRLFSRSGVWGLCSWSGRSERFPARTMAAGKSASPSGLSWIFSSETATAFLNFSDKRRQNKKSSRNKLPFMILDTPEQTAERWVFRKKDVSSYREMHFPTENCTFLQKNAFLAEKCTFLQKNAVSGGTWQEIAGGLQSSRIKNASQLSQEENDRSSREKSPPTSQKNLPRLGDCCA